MNDKGGLYVALGLALAAVGGYALFLIGASTLKIIALTLTGALAMAGIIGASALPIRAWRRQDAPPVQHVVERHTHTITEGRAVEAPRIYQIPQMQTEMFPALLNAAWQAGQLAAPQLPVGREVPVEGQELRPTNWGEGYGP